MLYSLKKWHKTNFNYNRCLLLYSAARKAAAKPVILKEPSKDVKTGEGRRGSVSMPVRACAIVHQPQIPSPVIIRGGEPITNEDGAEAMAGGGVARAPTPLWQEAHLDWRSLPKHYMKLSKVRLSGLVVLTSMAGYGMAPAPFDLATFALCATGTGLISCAANAINQYHEVPFDAQMARTRNRLLVCGHLTPLHALGFAAVSGGLGAFVLGTGVNSTAMLLGVSNLVLYTCIYTPMKRASILNTWVGSVVGALPPLMGWAGCMGGVGGGEWGGWLLAGILYAWQFPHFNALSWNLRPEYSRAGYRMMAVTNPDLCRRTALRYTLAIVGLSCAAPLVSLTNVWFAVESLPLNLYFSYLAWRFHKDSDSSSSRKLFRFSLIHLPLLMLLMLVNKHKPNKKQNETQLTDEERT